MTKEYKHPQQGTHSIQSPNREQKIEGVAQIILEEVMAYNQTKASRQQFEERIIRRCKNSIAYVESSNKKEYIAAIKVATQAFFELTKEPIEIHVKEDEDWDNIAKTTPDPDAWVRMVEKYGKETVANAHRFWNRNGRP
jgi:hypothetical protein